MFSQKELNTQVNEEENTNPKLNFHIDWACIEGVVELKGIVRDGANENQRQNQDEDPQDTLKVQSFFFKFSPINCHILEAKNPLSSNYKQDNKEKKRRVFEVT